MNTISIELISFLVLASQTVIHGVKKAPSSNEKELWEQRGTKQRALINNRDRELLQLSG